MSIRIQSFLPCKVTDLPGDTFTKIIWNSFRVIDVICSVSRLAGKSQKWKQAYQRPAGCRNCRGQEKGGKAAQAARAPHARTACPKACGSPRCAGERE